VPKEPIEMPEVAEAYRAYKQADKDALKMRFRARAQLGKVIAQERQRHRTQPQIAGALGVVTEQVRRYEAAYRQWLREHEDEPLD
jgi:hypothetical protein